MQNKNITVSVLDGQLVSIEYTYKNKTDLNHIVKLTPSNSQLTLWDVHIYSVDDYTESDLTKETFSKILKRLKRDLIKAYGSEYVVNFLWDH